MKKIGLIGGMSWESSKLYYEIINKKVKELLGGFHSCRCVMDSVDFAKVEEAIKNRSGPLLIDLHLDPNDVPRMRV